MTKEEEKYTTLDIDQCKWWVNTLFNMAKEQACNSHNFDDGEEIQAAQDKIIKALEEINDEQVRILNCEDIDIQKFTEAMKHQPLQVIRPSKDCVSLEVYKQVMWERDIAIEQLKELGYEFGEKIRTSDDCVSREKAIVQLSIDLSEIELPRIKESLDKLPPVTPTFPKGATNGDMIRAMFPNVEIYTDVINEIVDIEICEDSSELRCSVDWWDAPYKRGDLDGSN